MIQYEEQAPVELPQAMPTSRDMSKQELLARFLPPTGLLSLSAYTAALRLSDVHPSFRTRLPFVRAAATSLGHPFFGYLGAWLGDQVETKKFPKIARATAQILGTTVLNFSVEVTQSLVIDREGLTGDFLRTHSMRMETLKDFSFALGGLAIYNLHSWYMDKRYPAAEAIDLATEPAIV